MNHKIHQWVHKGSSNNSETAIMAVIAEPQKAAALLLRVWLLYVLSVQIFCPD
ncbi:hypothetical protein OO006_00385 [Prosthecochloris sp. SCSIO W1101]|uniref:hypothetical protein n=1 Tax=Prosthecochloris sp. SCSIO W1101 TaxID=2992242 RepID=UPI00223DC365|nr:hypothetical protein [Prosthecochloris sp. SCSIO W1101]UZJ41510.1 hypothetical protein OO006_00385 [Prosthecochloris sp. SCSIO W1101]